MAVLGACECRQPTGLSRTTVVLMKPMVLSPRNHRLRKKERFGHQETPYNKCCDRKTSGSVPLAKQSMGTLGPATVKPALEGLGWRKRRTETRKLCTAQLAVDTRGKVSGWLSGRKCG
uniref:Uncharacterized protein n=1 Tax=Macaca fascicularis TaxID=9541 RepID=A0A7N9D3S1_MACFA